MQAQFVTAQEVAEIMGVSRSKAYQIVREMNRELKSMGYIDLSATAASVRVPADEVLYAEVLNHRMRLLTRAGEFFCA